jgi:hypothetical protein
MSHRDLQGGVVRLNGACLKRTLLWLLQGIDWSPVVFRNDCTWTPRLLATTALLWVWSDELTLVERFQAVRRISLWMFPQSHALAGSYQAFTKVLRRWTSDLIPLLQAALRERLRRGLTDCWFVAGFVMFGVDGSRAELPRTRSHERAYSPSRKRRKSRKHSRRRDRRNAHAKKSSSPQLWLTTMWHAGSGLPWDWRIGPADSSERAHLLEMQPNLPPQALIAADAGFVGYEYTRAIHDSGRRVLLRIGSNVRLLKKLGFVREVAQTVYLWPDREARRQQRPLVLRLVVAHNGRHPVFLVTNVLSAAKLTDRQVIELYARRWGIELFYRHLKQTFQRRKLRSASAANARLEMEWSLVGLWALALYALVQIRTQGISPQRLSIASTLRAFRRMLRDYLPPAEPGRSLRDRLRTAIIDSYPRKLKASRDYPRKKQERPPEPPRIINASKTQVLRAQMLLIQSVQKG